MTNELVYAAYILIWPAITLGVLAVISKGVLDDVRRARRLDEDVI